jgi:hypothetical protein
MPGGWSAAATAASAALGAIFFVLIIVGAALAYSIAGSGNDTLTSGLNDFSWVCMVIASFPAAMLIMAGSFGLGGGNNLERAFFGRVAAVVLVLLGGTTWAGDGFWAPDGAYSRFISPIIALRGSRIQRASRYASPLDGAQLRGRPCLRRSSLALTREGQNTRFEPDVAGRNFVSRFDRFSRY